MPRCVFLVLAFATSAHAQTAANAYLRSNPKFVATFREVTQPLAAGVVRVQCDGKDACLGTVVGADGWILAKAHDLKGKITCATGDGKTYDAKIVGAHETHDLALLKIAADGLRVVKFAGSKDTKPGSWIASVGMNGEPAAVGVVSVAARKVAEGFLGVLVDASAKGLVILKIGEKSAAADAGLQPKDVILSINNVKVADPDQLQQILGGFRPGEAVALKIRRADMVREIRATLQSREQAGGFRAEFQNRLGSELSTRRGGYDVVLQHDSVLKPSDCGGPLVDLKGRVIGINVSRAGRVETWAIPGEIVTPLIAELKSSR